MVRNREPLDSSRQPSAPRDGIFEQCSREMLCFGQAYPCPENGPALTDTPAETLVFSTVNHLHTTAWLDHDQKRLMFNQASQT